MSQFRPNLRKALLSSASLALVFLAQPAAAQNMAGMRGAAAPAGGGSRTATGAPVTTLPSAAQAAIVRQNAIKARVTTAADLANQAQAAARTVALSKPSSVPNGLTAGGLVVDPRIAAGSPNLWVNASKPVQTSSDGKTLVTVTQTDSRAVLTWQSFKVGKDTTVHFDQSGGNSANGNAWVALNRIDATGSPSRIEGQIKAEGSILLINPDGIVFGAGSQINTHSLVAAAMDINTMNGNPNTNNGVFAKTGANYASITIDGMGISTENGAVLAPVNEDNGNRAFLANGLFTNPGFNTTPGVTGNSMVLSAAPVPGQTNAGVTVEKGASIATDVSGFDNGGFVGLFGPQVTNAGRIETKAGGILLGAGSLTVMTEPATGTAQTNFTLINFVPPQQNLFYTPPSVTGGAHAINTADGLLISNRGNVTLLGNGVEQDGVIQATTSITRAGSINLTAMGALDANDPSLGMVQFGKGSVTAIMPEENGETIPSDATSLANFVAPTITIGTTSMDMKSGSLVYAPGAAMTIGAGPRTSADPTDPIGRILFGNGSTVDLSGLNAVRDPKDYLFTFKVTANDIADTPLAKALIGQQVTVDLSLSGTRADGQTWVGSPLFASSGAGYLANVTQGIIQLLSKAGSLTIGTTGALGGPIRDVITAPGSAINVSGGSVTLRGGVVQTSQVLGADGRTYDIGDADPTIAYLRTAGGYQFDHVRWGITDTYVSSLGGGSGRRRNSYVNGSSAGKISLAAVNPIVEGDILADILIGEQQRRGNAALPNGGGLTISLLPPMMADTPTRPNTAVLDSAGREVLGDNFSFASALTLPKNTDGRTTIYYSADQLSAYGLGSITINGADTLSVAQGAQLSVRDGGSIALGEVTHMDGALIAHAGSIALTGNTPFNKFSQIDSYDPLTVGATGLLDVSGRWVNDTFRFGEAYQGSAFVNGGSVSIITGAQSQQISTTGNTVNAKDRTLSIQLDKASVIDLSSGGYVGTNGRLKYGADGMPTGKGGNLSLLTYGGDARYFDNHLSQDGPPTQNNLYAPMALDAARIFMNGTVRAGGLSQGGTITLQMPNVVIDGAANVSAPTSLGDAADTLLVPANWLRDTGFGTLALSAVGGNVTMTAGTTINLQQKNYLIDPKAGLPADGASLRDFATFGLAPDSLRHAANLSLSQQNPLQGGNQTNTGITAQILLDKGASIVADPGAAITLNALGGITLLGDITAHGGSITATGFPGFIWVGSDAKLDVSGTFVPDVANPLYETGTVLNGGSISLLNAGELVVLKGAEFDLSGASATIEVPGSGSFVKTPATRDIWSNGGKLSLSSSINTWFAGTIDAAGGAPQAVGGTLLVDSTVVSTGGIVVSQGGDLSAPFARATGPISANLVKSLQAAAGTGTTFITADTMNGANSGLDTVLLKGSVYFSGNVDLAVKGTLDLMNGFVGGSNASRIGLLPAGATNVTQAVTCTPTATCIPAIGTTVNLSAGYVRLDNGRPVNNIPAPRLGDGRLNVHSASQIDIQGRVAIDYAGSVNLTSDGDIRLLAIRDPNQQPAVGTIGGVPNTGALLTADNLTLTARTIYPSTDTQFLLQSTGAAPQSASGKHNTITFASNGAAPVTPYAVGGRLLVDARAIVQGGNLMAPMGTIQLGYGMGEALPADFRFTTPVVSDKVMLAPGSLTSVSLGGLLLPYGYTTDKGLWSENSNSELAGPPVKLIKLAGANVDTQAGAVIDGSGGGDIYSTEFVPGTGGSRNLLTTTSQTVYALVPGYQGAVAPIDPDMITGVAAGMTVTLDAGKGVLAGTYTLLPAEYATLPGAYRVVIAAKDTGTNAVMDQTMADGSVYRTGRIGNALNGSSQSQNVLFQIQSNNAWTKYTQIDITKGNDYFAALAASTGKVTPRIAADAAQISLAATQSLTLNATNKFAADKGGRGGQVDIAGANLLVVASDLRDAVLAAGNYTGYLVLDADQVSKLGVESVLLGGNRATTTEGVQITATALNLEVATNAAHALTGPDLLLTSIAPTAANTSARGVVVDGGSVITALGSVSASSTDGLVFGKDPLAQLDNQGNIVGYAAGITGDGSLLRVSNGGVVTVTRHFVPGVYVPPATTPAPPVPVSTVARGQLTIGDGAAVTGNALTLDSSGNSGIAGGAVLTAKNYDLSAAVVNVGGGSNGLIVNADLLAKFGSASLVTLRSASVFNLYDGQGLDIGGGAIGTLVLDGAGFYGQGGKAAITANTLVLTNTQVKTNNTGGLTGTGGSLTLKGTDSFIERGGNIVLASFADVAISGGKAIRYEGSGSLTAANGTGTNAGPVAVALDAPNFVAAPGARQALTTAGALTIRSAGIADAVPATEIGGSVSFTGGTVDVAGHLTARGGILSLTATDGDLNLAAGTLLDAAGSRIAIGPVTQDVAAGTVKLISTQGNITLAKDAVIDVSGAGDGYAGTLAIATALDGTTTLDGTIKAGGTFKDTGGNFTLVTGRLDGAVPYDAGFTRQFRMALYQPGDIVIEAGRTLSAIDVGLVANQGSVIVNGTIDASASTGGSIALYGAGVTSNGNTMGGVTVNSGAKLIAAFAALDKDDPGYANGKANTVTDGGKITLGTTGYWDGSSLNADGSELVRAGGSGTITVASGALIDVSAGKDGQGGTVDLRAPIVIGGSGQRDVNVAFYQEAGDSVKSASGVNLNAYAVWSTTDPSTGGNHFDGIIDPAGWFKADGTKIAGTTDAATGLFTPTDPVNTDHVTFYQTTLLGFVQDPFGGNDAAVKGRFGSGVQDKLRIRPELDLYNPDKDINKGDITVASNWNFGAASLDDTGAIKLLYRTLEGEPGSLMLRAANNVRVNATITDGFYLPFAPPSAGGGAADPMDSYNAFLASDEYKAYLDMFNSNGRIVYNSDGSTNFLVQLNGITWADLGAADPAPNSEASAEFFGISQNLFDSLQFQLTAPTVISGSDPVKSQYALYYSQYLNMFRAFERETVTMNTKGMEAFGLEGGVYASHQYLDDNGIFFFGRGPAQFNIPTQPTTANPYYNIANPGQISFDRSSGNATPGAADYVTQWEAYFFNVLNDNLQLTFSGGAPLPAIIGDTPTLENAPGIGAQMGVVIGSAVTPPFAPPAYTTLQPGSDAPGGASATTQYNNFVAGSTYQSYLGMLSGSGRPIYNSDGATAGFAIYPGGTWADLGIATPPANSEASAAFFNISQSVFDSLQFKVTAPTVINGSNDVKSQYAAYYEQYLSLFDLYQRETLSQNYASVPGLSGTGGLMVPFPIYADAVQKINGFTVNPAAIPTMPTTATQYYNIANGSGFGIDNLGNLRLTSSDYVTLWQGYFYTVLNNTILDNSLGGGILGQAGITNPELADLVGVIADKAGPQGVISQAIAPPYAPPAYTTIQQGSPVAESPVPPQDRIDNNPGLSNAKPTSNTTSSTPLMTQAMSGKGSFSYNFVAGAVFGSANVASVDPNAVLTLDSAIDPKNPVYSVLIDGHTEYQNPSITSERIAVPTLVRTGTGDITLTAAGNVAFIDPIVQGAVYTGGYAIETPDGFVSVITPTKTPTGLVGQPVWGVGGGDVKVTAGQDILGIETLRDTSTGTYGGVPGGNIGPVWSDWFLHAISSDGDGVPYDGSGAIQAQAWVNYAGFFQQFGALGGGNIALTAGRDVTDVSAALPQSMLVSGGKSLTDPPVLHVYGGGNLTVNAGRDLNSGQFLVGRGAGEINVGGLVQVTAINPLTGLPTAILASDGDGRRVVSTTPLSLLLGIQDGYVNLVAKGDVTLGNVIDPTAVWSNLGAREGSVNLPGYNSSNVNASGFGDPFTSFGANSGVALTSVSGDVVTQYVGFQGNTDNGLFRHNGGRDWGPGNTAVPVSWPASLLLTAITGDINMVGASDSGVSLISRPTADGGTTGQIALLAGGSVNLGTRLNTFGLYLDPHGKATVDPDAVAADDPFSIVARQDINFVRAGRGISSDGKLSIDRPSDLWAGRDIINLNFTGQNNDTDDVTSIIALGDITGRRTLQSNGQLTEGQVKATIYGPGTLLMQAGGDILMGTGRTGGQILSVGDGSSYLGIGFDLGVRAGLGLDGADIVVRYGVGPGVDYAAAIDKYVNPAHAGTDGIDYLSIIAKVLGQSNADAWKTFQGLSTVRQQLLVDRAFLDFQTQVATEYRDPKSPYFQKYGRAYATIATLYPASLGYTDNNTSDSKEASTRKITGNMNMARTGVMTQIGGDIEIIGPGGGMIVGSNSTGGDGSIITLQGGTVRTYTDGDLQLFQGRIFTEQGGDVNLFSANGDLNAGKGPKTSASYPALRLICNADGYCRVNPAGLVTGAGIGALLSIPGQDPTKSNASLTAPHGTVDAGAAGIRVAGNLNIVALHVANAFNIDVGGVALGIPTNAVDVQANLDSSSTAANAAQEAVNTMQRARQNDQPSLVIVTIDGFGPEPEN